MRQFFLRMAFVLGCFVLSDSGSALDTPIQDIMPAYAYSQKEYSQVLSPFSSVFDPAAIEENRYHEYQRMFRNTKKYPVSGVVTWGANASAVDRELSNGFLYTGCLIEKLEGPDLIYPHFYSW